MGPKSVRRGPPRTVVTRASAQNVTPATGAAPAPPLGPVPPVSADNKAVGADSAADDYNDLLELVSDQADLLALSLRRSGGFHHSGTKFTTGTLIVGLDNVHNRFKDVVTSIKQVKVFYREGDKMTVGEMYETFNLANDQQPVLVAVTNADNLCDEIAQEFPKWIADIGEKKSVVQVLLTTANIAAVHVLIRSNCSPAYLKEVVK